MRKVCVSLSIVIASLFFLLAFPKNAFAYPNGCNGPNGKTGTCYGQITCSGITPTLCCDTQAECDAALHNPTYINCTASSIPECLASQPIGCIESGTTYCCATNDDCTTRLGGTVDPTRSHKFSNSSSDVTCEGNTGIQTAIGCIHVLSSPEAFLSDILKWAVGVGGGIAFLLILYAGFMIMTATGDPKRIQAGQELLTSAIGGLILLVLSVFVLKFIGIDILRLCKFGFGTCTP